MKKLAVDLMLDSGAFSAWNRGTSIDIKKYIAYVKRLEKYLFCYVTLDVLPEGQESKRTLEAVEVGAAKSHKNHKRLKDAGLKPIPVFHQGESFKWLEQMLKDGEPYIGLSARKDLRSSDHVKWLDQAHRLLTDSKGRPTVKTHGFGITNPTLLMRYPFYTVDSTTWSITPGYGLILVPVFVGGKPDYTRLPVRISTSGNMGANPTPGKLAKQFESMGPLGQESVKKFIDEIGLSLVDIRYKAGARRLAVLHYYQELMKVMANTNFTPGGASELKPVKHKLQIMYATAMYTNKQWSAELSKMQANTRLVSFFETQRYGDEHLIEYVTTGKCGVEYKERIPKARYNNEEYRNFRHVKLAERGKLNVEDGTT